MTILRRLLTGLLVSAFVFTTLSCGGSSTNNLAAANPTLAEVRNAIAASVGAENTFNTVVSAIAKGYSIQQIADAALSGRIAADGDITTAGGDTEAPVSTVLEGLTVTKDIQVLIEAKIAEVREAFFHDIGIDFNFSLNAEDVVMGLKEEGYTRSQIFNLEDLRYTVIPGTPNIPFQVVDNQGMNMSPPLGSQGAVDLSGIVSIPIVVPDTSGDSDNTSDQDSDIPELLIRVTPSFIDFEHIIGATTCPQPLGNFKISNLTNEEVQVETRSLDTAITLQDGETVVLGGLVSKDVSAEFNCSKRIPFLAEIPVLGTLFRNSQATNKKTEIIVFVTANVVDPAEG